MPDEKEAARLAEELVEAKRVADEERRQNMAALRAEQADAQRQQGKREGLAQAHTADQDRQIQETTVALNDFMRASLAWQQSMAEQLRNAGEAADRRTTAIEKQLGEFLSGIDAIAKAAGVSSARTFTRWQVFGVVTGFLIALLVAVLLIVSTIHGLQTPTGK